MALSVPTRAVLVLGLLVTIGCGRATPSVVSRVHAKADCSYVASLEPTRSLAVDVECQGARPRGFRAEPGVARYVSQLSTRTGAPLDFDDDTVWLDDDGSGLFYRVDLDRMAAEVRDFNYALRVGDSIIAPGYSWMLSPAEVPDDLPVSVRVNSGPQQRFVSGMASDGHGYRLRASEIRVATYGIFGRFESDTVEVAGVSGAPSRIEVITLDGSLAVGPSVRHRWIDETARAVAAFYAGFPAERAMLAIVPVRGRAAVLHGKVLPESNPGVALLLGSEAGPEDLYADWILTHELFHLGFPSFVGEGKWLDEGLATYFEPLIRARKHWLTPRDVWSEFFRNMPRGRGVLENDGLENPKSFRAMYWAGAAVALMADVEALKRSNGTRGLQDGLRALLRAGGEANRVWRLEDAIRRIDQTLGAPILADLARRYDSPGQHAPLSRLFDELGVRQSGESVVLDDDAPLAHVRRAIIRGAD